MHATSQIDQPALFAHQIQLVGTDDTNGLGRDRQCHDHDIGQRELVVEVV